MNSPEITPSGRPEQDASTPMPQTAIEHSEPSETASVTDRSEVRGEVTEMIEQTRQAASTAAQYVRDKPLVAVGIAAAVGLIAGLLARRPH